MNRARYELVREDREGVLIRDLGPWSKHPTVTNAAEQVVAELLPTLRGRRLYYFDSNGELDELVVRDGRFAGFAPGGPIVPPATLRLGDGSRHHECPGCGRIMSHREAAEQGACNDCHGGAA